jgi:hypothetical protein
MLLLISVVASGQDICLDGDQSLKLQFDQEEFKGRFAVAVESDNLYHYYVTDLTRFSTIIEKAYFLNLIFQNNVVVSIDSDLNKDQLWFKIPLEVRDNDAVDKLGHYHDKAKSEVNLMTEEERSAWLELNQKLLN